MTHRGVDCELVCLRDLIIQLLDHGDYASGTVDGKELRWGLEGVEDAAPCTQVRIGGVDDEDGGPHWCVLSESKVNKRMSLTSPEAAASISLDSPSPQRPLTALSCAPAANGPTCHFHSERVWRSVKCMISLFLFLMASWWL